MFALPVLRQGDLPLLREHRVAVEHLLARSGGLARHALFACKKRDSPERTQAGAVDRVRQELRVEFFCDFCFFPNLFILSTALKLFRF
jgi:hypothetical protein